MRVEETLARLGSSSDPLDQARYLRARIHAGTLVEDRIRVAAYGGHRGARLLLSDERRAKWSWCDGGCGANDWDAGCVVKEIAEDQDLREIDRPYCSTCGQGRSVHDPEQSWAGEPRFSYWIEGLSDLRTRVIVGEPCRDCDGCGTIKAWGPRPPGGVIVPCENCEGGMMTRDMAGSYWPVVAMLAAAKVIVARGDWAAFPVHTHPGPRVLLEAAERWVRECCRSFV